MADSSSNTIETVDTLVEALRYASNLVDNTDGQVGITYEFLSTYDYYGSIYVTVPLGAEIEVPIVDLPVPDMSQFYSYTQETMANYFYLNTDATVSGTNTMVEVPGVANEYQMLTQELLSKYSLVADGKIELNTAYYGAGVSFDPANDDDDTVIPLSVARSEYYDTTTNISIADADWDIYVRVGSALIVSPIAKNYISIVNADITKEIQADVVNLSTVPVSFDEMLKDYVGPELEIDGDAQLPEELMTGTSNLLTGRDVRDLSVFRAGSTVRLTMPDKMSDTDLLEMINDYFVSSGYFSAYDGVDMMLTHDQVELVAEHIIKRVMSVNELGLEI